MKNYLKMGLTNPKQSSRIQHIDDKSIAKIYRLKDDDRESKLIQRHRELPVGARKRE